jgi:isoquinoline 1-oxidoreductase alpha subunit
VSGPIRSPSPDVQLNLAIIRSILTATLQLNVNGTSYDVPGLEAERPLLWYLRDSLALHGTKFGCGHGGCGACTVEINGHAARSCIVTVGEVAGNDIVTIEGLATRSAESFTAQDDSPRS